MYTEKDLDRAKNLIAGSKNVAIIIHKKPDPDALGSAVAMESFLKGEGKNVDIYSPSKIPGWLSFVKKGSSINIFAGNELKSTENYDLTIFLDGGELNRFSEFGSFIPLPCCKTLKIDHHNCPTNIADVSVYSEGSSSTAEIVYDFLKHCEKTIDSRTARHLLIGILGDTGWLKYGNTTPLTLQNVADLSKINNCFSELDSHFNHGCKSTLIPAWKVLMKNLTVDTNHSFLFSSLSYKEINFLDLTKEVFSDAHHLFLSTIMREFSDIEISAIFIERVEGEIHGSLRSEKGCVNVGKICSEIGQGNGHLRAGGFSTKKSLERILPIIYKGLDKYKV